MRLLNNDNTFWKKIKHIYIKLRNKNKEKRDFNKTKIREIISKFIWNNSDQKKLIIIKKINGSNISIKDVMVLID